MRTKIFTFLTAFVVMGLLNGAVLYFFGDVNSKSQIVGQAMLFGFFWGLAEVFVFPWIRKRFKKKKIK